MKSERKYLELVIVMIFIVFMDQSMAGMQYPVPVSSASTGAANAVAGDSLVLNARRHWQSFLKLASKPNAIVTVNDLESAFGQKALHREQVGFYNYYRIQDVVTLTPISDQVLQPDHLSRMSSLIVFDFLAGHDPETCIASGQVIRDLQRAGWVLKTHTPGAAAQGDVKEIMPSDAPYGSYSFVKGDQGVLSFGYSEKTTCATSLRMESNKLKFDQINHVNATESAK
jgi:hypothetical protein